MDKDQLTELIMSARQGNQEALEGIFRLCRDMVYFLALKTVRNHTDALDIVQETFTAVFQNIRKLKNTNAFKGWLCQITVNKCKRFWKRNKDILLSSDENEGFEDITDADEDFIPQDALGKAETRNMIMSLIDSLPDEQRMSVILHYYEELKVEEIAKIMECPINTVKSRLFYARRQIKEGVENYEKRGVKLYGTRALPILTLLLREAAKESTIPESVSLDMLTSAINASGAASPGLSAGITNIFSRFTHGRLMNNFTSLPLQTKIIAGVVTGAVAITGAAAVPVIINNSHKDQNNIIVIEEFTDTTVNNSLAADTIIQPSNNVTEMSNESKMIPVNFVDREFENYIRLILNKPEGDIYTSDLINIKEIHIYGKSINKIRGSQSESTENPYIDEDREYYDVNGAKYKGRGAISSLDDIKYFENIEKITVSYNKIGNINALGSLKNLTEINLRGNNITPQVDLSGLDKLKVLILEENQLTDISGIKLPAGIKNLILKNNKISELSCIGGLNDLLAMDLSLNQIEDISALKNMSKLKFILLPLNRITDISAFDNLNDLEWVVLDFNKVSNVTPLSGKSKLRMLFLQGNGISDINSLVGLSSLEMLIINDNDIKDLTSLGKFTSLKEINIMRNNVSDIKPLENLVNLEKIDFNKNNHISDITPLANLINLKELILGFNEIENISPLANLNKLEVLWLNSNKISDIRPISNLTNLKSLYLITNKISDISPLRNLTGLEDLHIQDNIITDFSPLSGLVNTKIEGNRANRE